MRRFSDKKKAPFKELEIYRKKRKRVEEQEKKKKMKLEWKEKMSGITPILIAENVTKPGKVSSVAQVRKYLVKKKKLSRKEQKTITESNVVEKLNSTKMLWAECFALNYFCLSLKYLFS